MKKYRKVFKYILILLSIITVLISVCFIPISASRLIPVLESQVAKELGVKVHVDKLVLRVGPHIKIKAPIMHIMYEDGHKFAQLNNVKFYIPWHAFFKDSTPISKLKARKLTVRLASDDEQFLELMEKLKSKDIDDAPSIQLKEYSFTYYNKELNDKYIFDGHELITSKIKGVKNFTLKARGDLQINNKKYINYDIILQPKINFNLEKDINLNLSDVFTQIQELDFHSDIVSDIKLYNSIDGQLQASGFINIDNMSVLDIAQKNPKSFLYLTLWGDKASLLSNIYTSPNKKVYLEGMLNNSKKPSLDLKVKTDDILLGDLYQKLKILTNFSYLKNITSVTGTINANFTLKGDINKIKSNGYLKVTDANLIAKSLKIENINSDIDFSNNSINIINTTGFVKNSPIILKGNIDKQIALELLMSKVELKHLLPENFGVKNGVASLVAKFSGTLDKVAHTENLQVENFEVAKDDYNIKLETLKLDTNKDNIAYLTNLVCNNSYTEQIKIPSLKVNVDRDYIKIPDTNIYMPNSRFVLKSDITNFNSNNLAFNTRLDGVVNSKDIKVFKDNSFNYPLKLVVNGNKIVQNINAQILSESKIIFDEPVLFNLQAKVDKSSVKFDDLSIISFVGNLSEDLKQNLKGNKKLILTGNIENFKKPIFKNIRLSIPQVLNLHYKDTLAQVKGDFFVSGAIDKPELVGQLNIQNLQNESVQLALSNAVIDFVKNNIAMNIPVVKFGDNTMSLVSTISTDFTNGIIFKNMNIKSKFLNLDTLLMYKDLSLVNTVPVNIMDSKFYSEKLLLNIYGESLLLSSFASDFSLKDGILNLKNITSEALNGKLNGNLSYSLKDENFNSQIFARGLSAAPVFDIISNRKDTISGVMDFDTDISGNLTSKQSLNGNVKFIVNNGRMSTLGKLEHLLYAQNVVADNLLRTSLSVVTKAITLKDTGLFKYLRGDIDLINGMANIKMLQSQGPLMSLFIKGNYNPMNDYAQLTVLGRLSDEVISGLGSFGDFSLNKLMIMLTGEETKSNILPEDYDKIPQLSAKNTKEFRSLINGIIDKPSSVLLFNWISYSEKSLKQKDVPMTNIKVPDFVDKLPY